MDVPDSLSDGFIPYGSHGKGGDDQYLFFFLNISISLFKLKSFLYFPFQYQFLCLRLGCMGAEEQYRIYIH